MYDVTIIQIPIFAKVTVLDTINTRPKKMTNGHTIDQRQKKGFLKCDARREIFLS